MKKSRIALLLTSVLIMTAFLGMLVYQKGTINIRPLDLFIAILIVLLAVIAFVNALKKDKEEQAGLNTEDELSLIIKYKAGYYAFLYSMYMWLFIFMFKDMFPDTETMLGGGVLLSALIFWITKMYIKNDLKDDDFLA